jgi:hypothetical protein
MTLLDFSSDATSPLQGASFSCRGGSAPGKGWALQAFEFILCEECVDAGCRGLNPPANRGTALKGAREGDRYR